MSTNLYEEILPSEFYDEKLSDRKPFEDRAIAIAKVSLPYVIRTDGADGAAAFANGAAQSFNGRLVNNLKAKMGMALLPPATSSFRLKPDAIQLLEMFGKDAKPKEEMRQQLSNNTDAINGEIENQQIRSSLFDMVLQQIVVGSVILEKVERKGFVMHTLKSYVVELDPQGEPMAMCVKETLKRLPDDVIPEDPEATEWELYTMLHLNEDNTSWTMRQSMEGVDVGTPQTFKSYDDLPFRYFGWNWVAGDAYHRPFAEDYYQDMKQVDTLSLLNTQGSVIAAKVVIMVNQRGGRTRKDALVKAAMGDVIDGSADDVSAFQLEKNFDFQVPNEREASIKKELQANFLDTGSVQRDAERVTAEEIRVMAQQLEASTLAGIYSKMALKWSKWMVGKVMDELGIKFETIEVSVLTGLDALGRSQEGQKLDSFVGRAANLQYAHWIKTSELLQRYADLDGINTVGLRKTSEEVAKEQQEAQKQQAEQQLMESGAQAAGQTAGAAAGSAAMGQQ